MILYKYFAPGRIDDVLKRCRVRYTQPKAFNDIFELRPYVNSLIEKEKLLPYTDQAFQDRNLY